MLFSFCVAFRSGTSSPKELRRSYRNPGKEPALPAAAIREEAKSRAVVTRIMQIKRRKQPYRIPSARNSGGSGILLPKSIISTTTTSHSQRSPVEQSGFTHPEANLRCSPLPAMLLTQRPQISPCSAHLADISNVVPAARTLITLGTRYHCPELSYYTSIVLNIFIINTPRLLRNHEHKNVKINLTSSPSTSFSFLIIAVSIVSIFQRHFCFEVDLMPPWLSDFSSSLLTRSLI